MYAILGIKEVIFGFTVTTTKCSRFLKVLLWRGLALQDTFTSSRFVLIVKTCFYNSLFNLSV